MVNHFLNAVVRIFQVHQNNIEKIAAQIGEIAKIILTMLIGCEIGETK